MMNPSTWINGGCVHDPSARPIREWLLPEGMWTIPREEAPVNATGGSGVPFVNTACDLTVVVGPCG